MGRLEWKVINCDEFMVYMQDRELYQNDYYYKKLEETKN